MLPCSWQWTKGEKREDKERTATATLQFEHHVLVLQAEKKAESDDQSKTYLHRERLSASCGRTINFPEEIDPSKVEGIMDKGILTLTVPKREPRPEERMTKLKLK